MTTTIDTTTAYDSGRDINPREAVRAIGSMTFLAISGGRIRPLGASAFALPISNGYRIAIVLDADDTFTVRREFVRGSKVFDKGTESGVYVDQLSDTAYRASCFRSDPFGG